MKKEVLIGLVLLFVLSNVKAQSFVIKNNGDRIECAKILSRAKVLILKDENSDEISSIENDSVKEYYDDFENAFYKNKDGFLRLIIEGNIQVLRGEPTVNPLGGPAIGNISGSHTKWYVEKDGLLFHAFTEADGPSRVVWLRKESLKELMDDEQARNSISELGKKIELDELLGIIQSYNANHYLKNERTDESPIPTELSKIILFRDFGKETKEPLTFTINGQTYTLDRNSKLEVLMPNEKKSVLCLNNSDNNACGLIKSSPGFIKYYQLKLDKKMNGTITRVNGNSSYYKTRLEFYDKRAKK